MSRFDSARELNDLLTNQRPDENIQEALGSVHQVIHTPGSGPYIHIFIWRSPEEATVGGIRLLKKLSRGLDG